MVDDVVNMKKRKHMWTLGGRATTLWRLEVDVNVVVRMCSLQIRKGQHLRYFKYNIILLKMTGDI